MANPNFSVRERKGQYSLEAENASLRIKLNQAQDLCVAKEKKNIEYIYHINRLKINLCNKITQLISVVYSFFFAQDNINKEKKLNASREEYLSWLAKFEVISTEEREKINTHIARFSVQRKFSIIILGYESGVSDIMKSVQSLQNQIYPNWDVYVIGDEAIIQEAREKLSINPKILQRATFIEGTDFDSVRQILSVTNFKLLADYVGLINPGDILSEFALYEFAAQIELYPNLEALYCDEDSLSSDGERQSPCFKTDWNLELFLAQNYTGNLCLFSKALFTHTLSQLNPGSRDEALSFRALTSLDRENIGHIAKVLYHRQYSSNSPNWMSRSGELVSKYLSQKGVSAELATTENNCWIKIHYALPAKPPLVTIIVPTRNRPDLLSKCLMGVLENTEYKNIEFLIIDHQNDHPGFFEIASRYESDTRVRILPYFGEFDHSDMNNKAAEKAQGDVLLFLNDDIEVIEPNWLSEIITQLALPDRGVVGARLLYPDKRIQHAGVVLGFGGVAGHGHLGLNANAEGYFGRLIVASEVSGLTGACMAINRQLFEEIGGFSAKHLARTFNDVDLCLKARERGKINIYTPLATLIHHESASLGGDLKLHQYKRLQREVGYMLEHWGLMQQDPYYNVNLSLEGETYALSFPPRRVAPWIAAGL